MNFKCRADSCRVRGPIRQHAYEQLAVFSSRFCWSTLKTNMKPTRGVLLRENLHMETSRGWYVQGNQNERRLKFGKSNAFPRLVGSEVNDQIPHVMTLTSARDPVDRFTCWFDRQGMSWNFPKNHSTDDLSCASIMPG